MKQLQVSDYEVIHVEITIGLREDNGKQHTTRDVTTFLQELNRERSSNQESRMTFKVFSGYAAYPVADEGEVIDIIENVALLHLDYNPVGKATERFDTLTWYVNKLMCQYNQDAVYAHFATDSGHRMLLFTTVDPDTLGSQPGMVQQEGPTS